MSTKTLETKNSQYTIYNFGHGYQSKLIWNHVGAFREYTRKFNSISELFKYLRKNISLNK